MVPIDPRGTTSYQCSIVTLGLGVTAVELYAVKVSRHIIPEAEAEEPGRVSNELHDAAKDYK